MNLKNEPIVNTPDEAIACFRRSRLADRLKESLRDAAPLRDIPGPVREPATSPWQPAVGRPVPRVIVCIPAYGSGKRIAKTLQSVQDQTFGDFRVLVAIEPAGEDAFDAQVEARFAEDRRFHFSRNASVLGWAGNIDGLLARVDTELFVILPHDDLWAPDYLAALAGALDRHPAAVLAYADVQLFGAAAIERCVTFDNSSVGARLFSFYLKGAEGHPWRGLARRSVLPAGPNFPQHPHMSFAVECEWTQHLLRCGEAIRVPRKLYLKRAYAKGKLSVSRHWRDRFSVDKKRAALAIHRERMLAGIPDPLPGNIEREAVVLACEIAMLQRTRTIGLHVHGLSDVQRERIDKVRERAARLEPPVRDTLFDYLERVLGLLKAPSSAPVAAFFGPPSGNRGAD